LTVIDNPELIVIIEEMLYEFMGSKPDTMKVPSTTHDGSYNRVCTTFNPEWYREMCKDFPRRIDKYNPSGPNKKKPRTIVKRQYITLLMENLIKHGKSDSKYASYITGEAERRFETYESAAGFKPWKDQF
jgi:hypothetical protein